MNPVVPSEDAIVPSDTIRVDFGFRSDCDAAPEPRWLWRDEIIAIAHVN